MKQLALVLGWLLAAGASGAEPAAELTLPAGGSALHWNAKEQQFSASIESQPLRGIMARLAAATGWNVYLDPAAERTITVQFTNSPSGEALRRLLGSLNFAVVPQKEGPPKLFIFNKSRSEATEAIQPAKEKSARGKDWLKNEIIVSLNRNSKRDIESLAKMLGAKVVGRNDKLKTYRLQFDSEEAAEKAREQLAAAPDLRLDDNFVLRPPEGSGLPQGALPPPFNLKPAINPDGTHTIVAVVDTAVQPLDEAKSPFLLPQINVAGEPDPAALSSTAPMHGTSMVETLLGGLATTAGGAENSSVRVLPINVYGNGEATSTFEVTLGVYEAVRNGARIVNLSLGGDGDSPLLDDLVAQARQRGVIFFAAAGNTPTTAPTYPAANPLIYAVTAGDPAGNIASYANRGSFIDLIAPGTSFMDFAGTTYRVTGTSPATAIVSGAAASFISSGKTVQQTEAQLRQTFGIRK